MSAFKFKVKNAKGEMTDLAKYKNQVLLVVNVASRCGFTKQYDGLELLYKKYKDRGLTIIGFPCNQFGNQEPGEDTEIQNFCTTHHSVTFPIMAKIDVNGESADPFYKWLTEQKRGFLGSKAVKWNFTKFLIGRDGEVVERFAPTTLPEDMEASIVSALGNQ